jgi:hypothetical protein
LALYNSIICSISISFVSKTIISIFSIFSACVQRLVYEK